LPTAAAAADDDDNAVSAVVFSLLDRTFSYLFDTHDDPMPRALIMDIHVN